MTPPLTPSELDALEAKLSAMTEGPWQVEKYPHTGDDVHINNGSEMGHVASFPLGLGFNAEGIAALRNNADELLRLARRGMELEAAFNRWVAGLRRADVDGLLYSHTVADHIEFILDRAEAPA